MTHTITNELLSTIEVEYKPYGVLGTSARVWKPKSTYEIVRAVLDPDTTRIVDIFGETLFDGETSEFSDLGYQIWMQCLSMN